MKCLVIIPYGGQGRLKFLIDTIESIKFHFKKGETTIVIVDDSKDRINFLEKKFGKLKVKKSRTKTKDVYGNVRHGSIFVEEVRSIREEFENKKYSLVVKLDDDAVVCGDGIHVRAKKYFDENGKTGMLGAFKKRGDGSKKVKDMEKKGKKLKRIKNFKQALEKLRYTKRLSVLVNELALFLTISYLDSIARRNEKYKTGNTCTGGCYFISEKFANFISEMRIPVWPLAFSSDPGEDTLMALLCYYSGMYIEDFPSDKEKIAINWKGLPASINEIISSSISVVHPVKGVKRMTEEKIRNEIKENLR